MKDYKVYSAKDLKGMKPGTVFEHCQLGKCIILQDRDKKYKYMVFKKSRCPEAFFMTDEYPWNMPMKVLDNHVLENSAES